MKKGTWMVIDGSVRKMKPGITLAFMQDKYPDKRIDKCHKPPSINQMEEWMGECGCESLDGCWVEPDGTCEHGQPSWMLALGFI